MHAPGPIGLWVRAASKDMIILALLACHMGRQCVVWWQKESIFKQTSAGPGSWESEWERKGLWVEY